MSDVIYFDYAAATPLEPAVLQAMQPFLTEQFYNPSATYEAARQVRQALNQARAEVAHVLGARPSEVIFTAGGTEANNLAIHGAVRRYPEANVLVSSIEHESVLAPAAKHQAREIAVLPDGRVDLDVLRSKINNQTVLISVMYANNEVGTVQPISEIGQLVAEIRRKRLKTGNLLPLYLHSDACQAANYLNLSVSRLGVDLLTLNGGKIYGPKQSGVLFIKAGVELQPLIDGGGQEQGLRSGTENVAAAMGFARALEIAQELRQTEVKRLQELQKSFFKHLAEELPDVLINGSLKHRLPNNIHLTFPDQDNERLLIKLDQADILAAAGSACSASDEEPSHVLKAMGLSEADAQASVRFTMGRGTTEDQLAQLLKTLQSLLS